MPELPWRKWYPTHWASEPGLRQCEPATRGIWFEAVNTMMLHQTYFVTGTIEELSALCICRISQMEVAILQIKKFNIGGVIEQNVNKDATNGQQTVNITLECRKLKRDCNISNLRSAAGIISSTKRQQTSNKTSSNGEHPSPSYSTSTSERISSEKELQRVTDELNGRKLSDYPKNTTTYNRIKGLIARRDELRQVLGVVA